MNALNNLDSLAGGNRIAFMLATLMLLFLMSPIAEVGPIAELFAAALYLVLLGSAIYLVSRNRLLFVVNVALTIAIAIFAISNVIGGDNTPLWLQIAWSMTGFVHQLLIVTLLATFIIRSKTVSREVLFAAIAIYYFIATIFALIYNVIELLQPGSFVSSFGLEISQVRLTYFSLVTLSTLGYGDIAPLSPVAQSISSMQATLGTFYIAILTGRFVSLYQHTSAPQAAEREPEPDPSVKMS